MDDIELVEILDTSDDLMEELASLRLLHSLVGHDIVKQLSTLSVLHDKVQLFRSLDDLVKLDNIWMSDHFQDVNLTSNSLNVMHILYLILFKNFYCNFFSGQIMNPKFDFSKSALSDCFT